MTLQNNIIILQNKITKHKTKLLHKEQLCNDTRLQIVKYKHHYNVRTLQYNITRHTHNFWAYIQYYDSTK